MDGTKSVKVVDRDKKDIERSLAEALIYLENKYGKEEEVGKEKIIKNKH